MEVKRDKKLLDKEIEEQMDREFKKRGIKLRIYYFTDMYPFRAITVVTNNFNYTWKNIKRCIGSSIGEVVANKHSRATYLLKKLEIDYGLSGIAICDKRDTFSRQEGRCRAKRRLLRHLKGRC